MMSDYDRKISPPEGYVSVELKMEHSDETGFMKMKFAEVRLLSNGWLEGREPDDEPERKNFFPPEQVLNVIVYGDER